MDRPNKRLAQICAETMAAPEMVARLNAEGAEGLTSTPQGFAAHIAAEIERWGVIARRAGLRAG